MSGPTVKSNSNRTTRKASVKLTIPKYDGYTMVFLLNRRLCAISNKAEHPFAVV